MERSFPPDKLNIDDVNFGQFKWWHQKWREGQGSSRLVTTGTGVNGLMTALQYIYSAGSLWWFTNVQSESRLDFHILLISFLPSVHISCQLDIEIKQKLFWVKRASMVSPVWSKELIVTQLLKHVKLLYTVNALPPFSWIRDFGEQNTRGNISQNFCQSACYWQIRLKSTNCSH